VDLLAVDKPWTYWLAIPITIVAVLGVLSLFLRYLLKVVAAKYPKQ
jgi:heme/copper-type cytochrome/quinol oxidase subunit 2